MVIELSHEQARMRIAPDFMECRSSADLIPLTEILGQDRAVRALQFGLKIKDKGFNIYVSGPPGTGRKTAITNFLSELAKSMPTPADWCYVNNFQDPLRPNALKIPAGKGKKFQKDMDGFIEELQRALSRAFESEEYTKRRGETLEAIDKERNELSEKVNQMAQKEGFLIQRTPIGLLFIPVVNNKPINDQELAALPQSKRQEILRKREALENNVRTALRQFRDLEKKADAAVEELNKKVASYAMEQLFHGLVEEYGDIEEVKKFLDDVENDILDNLEAILSSGQEKQPKLPFPFPVPQEDPMRKYKVNLIVDNSEKKGAPVVTELKPTYQNLFGKIEKEAQFGVLLTDYMMIRQGSLHKANGGFLVVPVEELLLNPFAWDGIKHAIMDEKLEIEEVSERYGFITTKSVKPEPIPFNAKVILVGSPDLYYALYGLDLNFKELFKVKADFDTSMEMTKENIKKYASFICSICIREGLKHLDPSGISAVLEYSSRLIADQKKLSAWFAQVADIIREASFYASEEGSEYTTRKHVEKALEEKVYRSNLIQKKIEEMIDRGVILIDTDGEKVGQVNGLAVLGLGDYGFGRPERVTATVSIGKDGVIDIEREAKMGGPIHTKGVMILSGHLSEKYAQEKPLSLTARLVFEQSYSGVEGDSASSTELYSILSALSGKPIKQYLAVTGSVNQKGDVQPIGGVNEKIEGFFGVCKAKGLNGKHGVVIPASNVENLMLKEEVLEAMRKGSFHIYPVKTIDEGIEVLTGVKAGARLPDGTYEEGTINNLAQKRLTEMAEKVKEYSD